ncbi:PepSY-associated TM helix domain-containing protein [Methylobacterium nodulans]|uniref:PepSY-associated TM helix domain protein n=1 Tax=Methylobacterium nodulans (strain LMG 21967 / CNCM I-2342 / ORS 2060) TaxID=460265 RepID=B8ISZ6_METNO|nr:PepSY-associated TM helix domain-containing protein [Methylobacterium nodulans]ACL55058.1 PepSY-associated TM helix domain protein [Methylobacterium nodulans ORS 2060]
MARLHPLLFQIHWFLGLSAGLVLMLCGVTGALLTFEDEIVEALSPGIVTVAPRSAPRLTPDALLARLQAEAPGQRVALLTLSGEPERAARIRFAPEGGRGRGETVYVDPYDGRILGPGRGEAAFGTILRLHRWLLIPGDGNGFGRTLTGASLLALVYLALSGLYLRWPKRVGDWRVWLRPALSRRGRPLYWSLHAVVGTWVLAIYLVIALTGLWWSFGWYRDGAALLLTGRLPRGEAAEARRDGPGSGGSLDRAFAAFETATDGRYAVATLAPPRGPEPIRIRSVAPDAPHRQARDEWRIRPDGTVVSSDLYAARPLGEKLAGSMLALHEGRFFGWPGTLLFFLAALAMPLFGVTGLLLYLGRRRSRRRAAARAEPVPQRG